MKDRVTWIKISLILFSLTLLSACGAGAAAQPATETAPRPPTPTPTLPATTPTPEDAIPPETRLVDRCSEASDLNDIIQDFDWLIAMNSYKPGPGFLWDIKTGNNITITNPQYQDYQPGRVVISPDGKTIAYNAINQNNYNSVLTIISSQGELLFQKKEGDNESIGPLYWLNNSTLVIFRWIFGGEENLIYLVNVNTGEVQNLNIEFPDQIDLIVNPSYQEHFDTLKSVYYSPNMEELVYTDETTREYILWDVNNDKEMMRIPFIFTMNIPRWAPDGSGFITGNRYKTLSGYETSSCELYLVHTNGQVERLTYLSDYYESVGFENYAWSPDGKKIAFWFEAYYSDDFNDYDDFFGIYDLDTGSVDQYCFEYYGGWNLTQWSPDSKYVLLSPYMYKGFYYLLNINTHSYAEILEDSPPAGFVENNWER